jgi:diguanylate cyclase (GGDEF)-like protein
VVSSQGAIIHAEVRLRHRDGHWVWVLIKGRSVEKGVDGRSRRISGLCADITERKMNEQKIRRLATYDTLTGIFNRAAFNEKLNEIFSLSVRTQQPFALMMLDLDEFKPVNDQYGHPVGDKLLQQVAASLQSECRDSDVVARLGGDEFALILPSAATKEGAKAFAGRLLEKVDQERLIVGHRIKVQASIGCCLYDACVQSADQMIIDADAALYAAKQQGKNTVKCCC